jgi:hypothetical protein
MARFPYITVNTMHKINGGGGGGGGDKERVVSVTHS